jgi:hypothetical protein
MIQNKTIKPYRSKQVRKHKHRVNSCTFESSGSLCKKRSTFKAHFYTIKIPACHSFPSNFCFRHPSILRSTQPMLSESASASEMSVNRSLTSTTTKISKNSSTSEGSSRQLQITLTNDTILPFLPSIFITAGCPT